jgi:hypothetical protein
MIEEIDNENSSRKDSLINQIEKGRAYSLNSSRNWNNGILGG